MSTLQWAGLGAIMLAAIIFCARIMRRGITTLEDDRKEYLARMAAGQRQIDDDNRNISANEQLALAQAALEDLLRLDNSATARLERTGKALTVSRGREVWKIELVMMERMLTSHKMLHGQQTWLLHGEGIGEPPSEHHPDHCIEETHTDIAGLMASFNNHWHGIHHAPLEPEHISRRIAAGKRTRHCQ